MSRPDNIQTDITRLYAVPIPTKRRVFVAVQGQAATVDFQLLDNSGNPVSLIPYGDCGPQGSQEGSQGPQGCFYSIEARIQEVFNCRTKSVVSIACNVTDETAGQIIFELPTIITNNPGVYFVEFGVYRLTDNLGISVPSLAFTNKSYLWVDRGLFGHPKYPNIGPPTLDEVRLFIRDNGPEENLLLDDFEFDVAEICIAAENAVRYWNEVNPQVGVLFTTQTYCARHKWLQAIAGHMFMTAAHRFRRNHLPYTAGGLSVDDQNKFQQYDQTGMLLTQEYKEWVKTKKVEINCYGAMTSSGSAYGNQLYQVLNTGV